MNDPWVVYTDSSLHKSGPVLKERRQGKTQAKATGDTKAEKFKQKTAWRSKLCVIQEISDKLKSDDTIDMHQPPCDPLTVDDFRGFRREILQTRNGESLHDDSLAFFKSAVTIHQGS